MKKLGITTAKQIVEAVEECESLELNANKTALRSKQLENLPEFKAKKKTNNDEKAVENVNPYDNLEVYFSFYSV